VRGVWLRLRHRDPTVPPDPAARIATPTTVLWPEHDPLFPRAWSDRLGEFFSAVTLEWLDGVGHFSPLKAPVRFAAAIREAAEGGS
jgi:pimeloyl-ACP methyl ester carboxylesterase